MPRAFYCLVRLAAADSATSHQADIAFVLLAEMPPNPIDRGFRGWR